MRLLLVEDEPLAQRRVKSILRKHYPNWVIVSVIQRVHDLKKFLSSEKPFDLILCDIQLADGLSFEAFEDQPKVAVPVIFITAYDQYALQSFDHNCIDYVLKPIDEQRLVEAFEKVERMQQQIPEISPEFVRGFLENYSSHSFKKRFLTKRRGKFNFVPTEEIAYFSSVDGLTYVVQKGLSERNLVDYSLKDLEKELLNPHDFFRINRSKIIQLTAIREIKPIPNGRLELRLDVVEETFVLVSRERVQEFKNWINQ